MSNSQATISATFSAQDCNLIIHKHSPTIKHVPHGRSLIDFLSFLSDDGWRVTQAAFEGFTLNLELEKAAAEASPAAPISVYLFHSFFISYFGMKSGIPSGLPPGSLSTTPASSSSSFTHLDSAARDQKALSKKFNDTIRADGWQELCTSKLLRTTGYWILSLWIRELPA